MNSWIFDVSIMFVLSVVLYTIIKKAGKDKIDNKLITLSVGALPVLFLGLFQFNLEPDPKLQLNYIVLFVFAGVVCSFIGNWLSVIAINNAPNAGLSLMIQKSYAPYTVLASVFIFASPIKFKELIGIIGIIVSIFFILFEKKKSANSTQVKQSKLWIIYSFAVLFLFGNLSLISYYLIQEGFSPVRVTFIVYVFAAIASLVVYQRFLFSNLFKFGFKECFYCVVVALCAALFNIFMQLSFKSAPHPGIVNIVNAASIAGVTLVSSFVFNEKIDAQKLIGIIGVIFFLGFIVF